MCGVGVAGFKNRSGDTPVVVSELFQCGKNRLKVKEGAVVTRPLGEEGES